MSFQVPVPNACRGTSDLERVGADHFAAVANGGGEEFDEAFARLITGVGDDDGQGEAAGDDPTPLGRRACEFGIHGHLPAGS